MTMRSGEKLAVHGGNPVRKEPMPPRHLFGEEEKQAALALFDKSIETGEAFGYNGPEEEAYCNRFAAFLGGGYADAVNSGTSAIYVALRALEIEPFTEVIVPSVSDMGGVMPVPLMNCVPVPADCAPGTYNMGPEQVEQAISERTSAIVVAHIAGIPVDMEPIMQLARARGIKVVEDCAQAHGARYQGEYVGTFGDVAAFSTMSGKHHATAAQGGVVYTRSQSLYWKSRQCSDRGKPFGLEGIESNVTCSLNLNLNDLSAAVGLVQLEKLPGMLDRIRRVARQVIERCAPLQAVSIDQGPPDTENAFWFMVCRLDPAKVTCGLDEFVGALRAEGLPFSAHYTTPFTQHAWFKNRAVFGSSGYPWMCPLYTGDPNRRYELPNWKANNDSLFLIKIHEGMAAREAEDIANALAKVEAAFLK
ncbi:MAG TPA: DegT/DnrJ/EryC1/StrS family aminotransferase [Candidatus Hydrogenedentes bacterium]|nr:DegT/DnrJ/EryC1/StrS family aminotransferase [Candidatus Hydrogenedentota bacterium]